jgi:hypothetical protein
MLVLQRPENYGQGMRKYEGGEEDLLAPVVQKSKTTEGQKRRAKRNKEIKT